MHRGEYPGAHHEGAEQAQRKGEDGEQQHSVTIGAALLADNQGVQQGGAEQPGQEGGVFYRIPEPPAAPAELVVGPPRAQHDAGGEKDPGAERPGATPVGHGAIQSARMERSHGEGEVDRKADVAEIEQGRVDDEADILQHGVEVAPLLRPRELAVKRAGEDQGIETEQADDQPHDGQYSSCDQRIDPLGAKGHQGAPQPQRKDEKEHGAFMAPPYRRQLEAQRQGAVGVLGHIAYGEIILAKAAGEQQQGGQQQERDQEGQRFCAAEQRA